jgi:hypothetical protein
VLGVATVGEHVAAALAHDDGGAGVLAHREHAARGDVGVAQQVGRDEAVVGRRLRIVEDAPQLGQVRRSQVVGDVVHGRLREQPQCLGLDLEKAASGRLGHADPVGGQQPVLGVGRLQRQKVGVAELRHPVSLRPGRAWPGLRPKK